ncbi:hypothetical protein C0993_009016 [Termitomyces sp. T159_Od127]|nr:hypothetical protein C0993_009016 [Termitomyces sp. T159_Od127]
MSTTIAPRNRPTPPVTNGEYTDYFFTSEPLGLPATQGFGWAKIEFDQVLCDGEWVIKRKLGWGMSSSIWLAFDTKKKKYVAIKVLKGYENLLRQTGHDAYEFAALHAVAMGKYDAPHCLRIYAAFNLPSRTWDGNHVCYVTELHGGNVVRLAKHYRSFPLNLSKRILLHTLRGIASTHENGYIHTDLKLDNIFFTTDMSTEDITSLLISDPSRRHDPEHSPVGMVQAAVSQPLPLPSLQDAMHTTFLLGDYSHGLLSISGFILLLTQHSLAQPRSDRPAQSIAIPPHRPPENVILAPWNEKSDIWQFGCLIFQLVTGKMLFKWSALPEYTLTEDANLLYQMMTVTGERFSPDYLAQGEKTREFFDENEELNETPGQLLSAPPYVDDSYRTKIRDLTQLDDVDAALICQLLSRCLRLNPVDRPNAVDLLSDPFFDGVD